MCGTCNGNAEVLYTWGKMGWTFILQLQMFYLFFFTFAPPTVNSDEDGLLLTFPFFSVYDSRVLVGELSLSLPKFL